MNREDALHDLIDRVYAAALEPDLWIHFAEGLSEAFGGSPVDIFLALPESHPAPLYYRVGFDPARPEPVYVERHGTDHPWRAPEARAAATRGFVLENDFLPEADLLLTDFYREWMEPRGLAPDGLVATFGLHLGVSAAVVVVFRFKGTEPFGEDDAAFGDLLFPHLQRAYQIYRRLAGGKHEAGAMAEVIHRLPAGVVLLDAQRQPVLVNPNARRLIELRDGFAVDEKGPRLSYPEEDEPFQAAVSQAIEAGISGEPTADLVLVGSRPSGRQPLLVIVTRLLDPAPGSPIDSAVAAVFLGNAAEPRSVSRDLLVRLYSLTGAEADLVGLLCEGLSLERAAERRGVAVNTVRWQVKQVFSKTGTRSQSDLIRLVLGATAPLTED